MGLLHELRYWVVDLIEHSEAPTSTSTRPVTDLAYADLPEPDVDDWYPEEPDEDL